MSESEGMGAARMTETTSGGLLTLVLFGAQHLWHLGWQLEAAVERLQWGNTTLGQRDWDSRGNASCSGNSGGCKVNGELLLYDLMPHSEAFM